MAGGNTIRVQVLIDTGQAETNVKKTNQAIESMGQSAKKATTEGSSALKGFTVSIDQTSRAVSQLAAALTGLAIVRIGADMIRTADQMNRVQISLTAITGSASQAAQMMAQLRDVAARSPFGVQALADGAKRLSAFGYSAKEVVGDIDAISKAVARMGGTDEDIAGLVQALGIMREKGVAQAQQMFRQIAGRAIDVMKIIRDYHQKATGEMLSNDDIRDLMEKGRLDGEIVARWIIDFMKHQSDATGALLQQPTSQFQKVKDQWIEVAKRIEEDVSPTLLKVIELIKELMTYFEQHEKVRKWAEAILLVASALTVLSVAMKGVALASNAVGFSWLLGKVATMEKVREWVVAVGLGFQNLAIYIKLAAGWLVPLAQSLSVIASAIAAAKILEAGEEARRRRGTENQGLAGPRGFKQFSNVPLSNLPLTTNWPVRPGTQTPVVSQAEEDAIKADRQLLEQQRAQSEQILAHAREADFGGLAAVQVRFNQIVNEMTEALKKAHAGSVIDAQTLANLKLARSLEVDKVLSDYEKKDREQQMAADKQALENRITDAQEAARTQVQLAGAMITDTAQAEATARIAEMQATMQGAEQVRAARLALADREHADRLQAIQEENAKSITLEGLNESQRLATLGHLNNQRLAEEERYQGERKKAALDTDKEIAQSQMETLKQVTEENTSYLKQMHAAEDNAQIASAERQIAMARMAYETGEAQTARQKIDAINKSTAFEIAAAIHVAEVKERLAEKDVQDRIDRANQLAQAYFVAGDYKSAQAYWDQAAILRDQFNSDSLRQHQELMDEETKITLENQKAINEAWIEEQKSVFEKFESGVGQVFDALFEKGKGFWHSMGDMALKAGKDILKSMLVPGISAGMMTAAGMPVHMEQKGDYGPGWLGQLISVTHQQPVFSQPPKLNIGDLSKVKLIPSGAYESVPVAVTNPQPPPQVTVNVGPQGISVAGAPPAKPPPGVLPPIMAPAAAIPAPGETPANYSRILSYSSMTGEPIEVPTVPAAPTAPGGGFLSLPIPGLGPVTVPLMSSMLMMGAAPSTGSTMTPPMGGYDANTAAPASGGQWSFAQAGLPTGGGYGGYGGYGSSWTGNMFNAGAYGGQQPSLSPMALISQFGGTGQAPGTPTGGFGMPNLPGMNLLKSISKAGGLSSWMFGPQQYYSVSQGTTYGAFGPSFAEGAAGPMEASDLPLSMGNAPYATPAASPFMSSAAASVLGPAAVMGGLMATKASYGLGQWEQNRNVPGAVRGISAGALGAFGGLLTMGGLMAMFPALVAAGPFGLLAAAGIGAAVGLIGAFHQTQEQHIRGLIKQMYGIDISNLGVLRQIAQIVNSKYGGADDLGVASPEVQQLINLYAATQGKGPVGPRPMYAATYQQQASTGGLQLQPVYSNGQVVANPYTGTTTTQWAMASQLKSNPQTAMFIQLDPGLASALFQGQVVNVLNQNPTVVGNANTASNAAGATRTAQLGGLLEPSTVVA